MHIILMTRRHLLRWVFQGLSGICLSALFPIGKVLAKKTIRKVGQEGEMRLPKPGTDGDVSLEKCIKGRRTIRDFMPVNLTLEHLSQILWAAQGITEDNGFKRAAPSGGALYPMDIYVIFGKDGVKGLDEGVYHYEPATHGVSRIFDGDRRKSVAKAALSQYWMAKAPINILITAEYGRICSKYGERGIRYAMIEAGHVGQNIFLQSEALGLSAGIVGAFHDKDIIEAVSIPKDHQPLLVMPVGYKG